MTLRARSLLNNSLTSVLSSGMLIFSTIFIPAILVRAISRSDYDLLSTILASLLLLSVIPVSIRGIAPSQLALAYARVDQRLATRVYARFSVIVTLGLGFLAAIGTELYIWFDRAHEGQEALFRFGLYCIAGHALGLIAIGIFTGPAAARRNFLPENFAKLWPGLYHLLGITIVWLASPDNPLVWICLVYLTSSWVVTALLAVRLWAPLFAGAERIDSCRDPALETMFWAGLRGSTWWNLTGYLAVNSATLIVSVFLPSSIVPFSVAASLLGIMSAGLIAVASPITGYAAGLHDRPPEERRRFFLIANTLFQLYAIGIAAFLVLIPQQVFVLWLKPDLAAEVRHICYILLPAYFLRQLTFGFTLFVMSAGRQDKVWLSPLLEAVVAVGGSIVLALAWGVVGVAVALAAAQLLRVLMTMFYDEPRNVAAICLHRGDTLWSGFTLLGLRR